MFPRPHGIISYDRTKMLGSAIVGRHTRSKLLPAVNTDRSVLAKLFFSFVHLAYKVNKALPRLGHSLLWPIGELELTHRS